MSKFLLTFELTQNGDSLEIHANKEGLTQFIKALQNILEQKEPGHEHMMTPSWGGNELSEEKQGIDNRLLNHVKICVWK